MRRLKLLVAALMLCYAAVGLMLNTNGCDNMNNNIVNIKEDLRPLNLSDNSGHPDSVTDYFKFYNLDFADDSTEHFFGTFQSQGRTLAGHIYKPAEYKATVFILHGYFDHCGLLSHIIKHLLEQGYAVAAFDLPGHGLSSGPPASIDDFSQYSRSLLDFTNLLRPHLNSPYHLVGHSTGGAAALDYLLTNQTDLFDKVILTAPLVHCVAWEQSKFAYRKSAQFVKSVPRVFRKNSSDSRFLHFVKIKDPLQARTVPLKWVGALHNWNDKITNLPACDKPVKVIQGTSDTTVDWKFNIDFIRRKFSDIDVTLIDNARHELFNESTEIRKEVFLQISSYLEQK